MSGSMETEAETGARAARARRAVAMAEKECMVA
jgi:hypothetical protein